MAAHPDGRDGPASLEKRVESDLARLFREPDPAAQVPSGAARAAARGPRDAAQELERYRARLLDLRNGNRLLQFEHSERSRAHVRAIDTPPDALYAQLNEGHQLLFVSLPEPEGKTAEEDGDEFLMALEEARANDPDYARVLAELDDADPDSRRLQAAEGALRERVREQLGLPAAVLSGVLPLAEHARRNGIDPSFELAKPDSAPVKPSGSIQTLLLADDMDRKLTGLLDRARTSLQEKGVNTLYAVFGFLEWYESPATAKPFHAPLLLVPVEIKRKVFKSRYRYAIRASGEEPQINLTLAARIAADFGIELPEFGEEDTPESYFAKVTQALASKHRWRVRRWVTIGHFAFARLVMYRDLDPRNWPGAAALERHPVLAALFGETRSGETRAGEHEFAEEHEPDHPDVARKVPLLITDADSSQFSALVDALDGKSLALQGPPGTGKSQTITNLIAAALAADKTVLFVAEKQAALEVVKNRLTAAGLGEFVLELHSTRAGKKEVMASIAERLKIQGRARPPAKLERDLGELAALRTRLARHAELLNGPAGALGLSLHQVLWNEVQLRQQHALPAGVAGVRLRDAHAVTPEQLERACAHLAFVERANAEIRARHGRLEDHPWFGLRRNVTEEGALLQAVQAWRQAAEGVRAAVAAFERTSGTRAPTEPGELATLAATLVHLPGGGAVDARYFAALSDRTTRSELKAYREAVESFREARDQLARAGDPARLWENPARIGELSRKARELRLADRSVAELGALLTEYRNDVAAWSGVVDTARQLLKLYGIEGPIGSRTVVAAMEGARIVASTPPEALVLRERALMDPVNGGALEDAARRQLEIQAELKRLSPDFSLPLDDAEAPGRLRKHAAVLNGAGLLSFLSSRVRAAREAWSELRRRPGQASDEEKSAQLYALAAAIEAAQAFGADGRLIELCTTHYRGHETDFHRLLAVNRFAREVRERLGTDSVLRQVRGVLLEGNLDILNDIVAFASPEVRAGLTWALAKCGPDNTHWEAFAIEVGEWARSITTLLEAAVELGLAGEVRLAELDALAAVAERATRCRSAMESAVAARILGPTFAPSLASETDAPALDGAVDVVVGLVSLGLSEELLAFLLGEAFVERRAALVEHGNALAGALVQAGELGAAAIAAGEIDELAFLGRSAAEAPFELLQKRLARALEGAAALGPWSAYCQALQGVEAAGLTPLLAAYEAEGRPYEHLDVAFRRALLGSIVRAAREQHPELAEVSGEALDAARARFQELDREVARQQCKELRSELCRRRLEPGEKSGSKSSWTGLALLGNEVKKRARHFPLRELVRRAGRTLQQAKPCFMMSPPSVAQYLAQGSVTFDLVVIDEASQMRPEDAIGALARGRQAIIVGDPMQLPPTGFFDRERPPTDEEVVAEDRANDESILAAALAAFPARRLRWHYRSRHAALIAFSNAHFYQGDLVVFPAPSQSDPSLGVQCVPVENGLYRGSMNRPEAERIAGEVLRFMQDHPDKSLGIVAMNQPQRDLILHEVERIVARDARAQRYAEHWEEEKGGLEPFFVKSLETVQGDERDVIFVSATYGPDASGRVHQRFGPINGPHGHRRLNVLFTRAKERVVLFTSMRPDQVEIDEHASRGRRALRGYLEYAQHGSLAQAEGAAQAVESMSGLEAHVVDVLRSRGYEAELRVGASGHWIDLAVRNPKERGAFVLGLEGDGPSYLGVRSTRDRDRLRAQVLEALGWQLHRIWSLAWHADPKAETERLLAAVEQATRRRDRAAKKAG